MANSLNNQGVRTPPEGGYADEVYTPLGVAFLVKFRILASSDREVPFVTL